MATDRIKGLDGIRAIAVLLVFATHKTARGNQLGLGGFGVHMFFVLSGFLIIGILHKQRRRIEEGGSTVKREWSTFMLRRTFRIFPVYYVCIAYMALAGMIGPSLIAQALTYTTNINIAYLTFEYPPEGGGHLWSLAVEEQFYLLAAPLILLTRSRHTRKICWGVIAVAIASSWALLAAQIPGRSVYAGSFSNFGLMALGGIVAVTPALQRVPGWLGPLALTAYLGAVLLPGESKQWAFWLSPLLIGLVIGALVSAPSSRFAATLHFAPLRWLGRISYLLSVPPLRLRRNLVSSSAENRRARNRLRCGRRDCRGLGGGAGTARYRIRAAVPEAEGRLDCESEQGRTDHVVDSTCVPVAADTSAMRRRHW